jgi:NAD(P)-dependent dehydrogenase (short-subunit alcohol dehydrogenase family)
MTEATAEQIRKLGRRSLALKCDVTDEEQVEAAVSQTVEELGSVDILVNNAGTLDHVGQFHDQSPALWERDYDHTAFWWLEPNDADNNVFAFARLAQRPVNEARPVRAEDPRHPHD